MTGLDLWSKEGAFDTLGLAHTGGMCKPAYSCLVTEFGTRKNHALHLNNDFNTDGKPPQNTNAVKIQHSETWDDLHKNIIFFFFVLVVEQSKIAHH